MLTTWPIRKKLSLGVVLLFVTVAILALSGVTNGYAFRGLVRTISRRATELPIAIALAKDVSSLRASVPTADPDYTSTLLQELDRQEFDRNLLQVTSTLDEYSQRLEENRFETNVHIGNMQQELSTLHDIGVLLQEIRTIADEGPYSYTKTEAERLDSLAQRVDLLAEASQRLPSYLQERMNDLHLDVRLYYRTWIVVTLVTSIASTTTLIVMLRLFYTWIFRPLNQLIEESHIIASGNFDHRIELNSGDEMDQMATALNEMTDRFQQIRDDLDGQVKARTREVIRGEQLASVGFLAAGVAHEINNPLASIALCAESLEERIRELLATQSLEESDQEQTSHHARLEHHPDEDENAVEVVQDYLRMMQDEAFRCKEITEQLLDFSRLGDVEKQPFDLADLVQGVVDMVQHVGKYKRKEIVYQVEEAVMTPVNPQEIKQVVLNLITNGLESLEPDGTVKVRTYSTPKSAVIEVSDNGCGMTPEVQEHLFEPFFTQGKDGQGTGLGMSITYRIINEHGGNIDVYSAGPGQGSRIIVRLPLQPELEEFHHQQEAA